MSVSRKYPIGAEIAGERGVHFRVWAPRRKQLEIVLGENGSQATALEPEGNGYFSCVVGGAKAGDIYGFRLDGGEKLFADPASRFQPQGPHGPSQIVDPQAYQWQDEHWKGRGLPGQVIYEMHIGTFTKEGTWQSAAKELPALAELGVTTLEIMPIADFPGNFGWGYDGVNMFAPYRVYGQPDDFRRFVDAAHKLSVGVILDVVYNHIGPDGNYLREFAEHYFSAKYETEWGEAINFDDQHAGPVREFFATNAAYWIDEYHLDGLRMDATQQIFDVSPEHILTVVGKQARAAAKGREIIIVSENERQHAELVRPIEKKGYGLDGLWNDDFHHAAIVALTGHNDAYYTDYLGHPQEFISAMKWGYLYQGQRYSWQEMRRGRPALDLLPAQFINFIQNHDQIANSARGERIQELTSPGKFRAMTALYLLGPGTPMLFMGQEFAASTPFLYFADHVPELAKLVRKGRADFLKQFPTLARPEMQAQIPDPAAFATFERCKLDFADRQRHQKIYDLHRDLLRLRRDDGAFRAQRYRGVDGAVLSDRCFMLRFLMDGSLDRLLIVNLGRDLHLEPIPEPLIAPPEGMEWQILWSSEDLRYGGCGTPTVENFAGWRIPGEAAVVLKPVPSDDELP